VRPDPRLHDLTSVIPYLKATDITDLNECADMCPPQPGHFLRGTLCVIFRPTHILLLSGPVDHLFALVVGDFVLSIPGPIKLSLYFIQKQDAGIWADERMRLQSKSNRNEWVLAPARGPTFPAMPDAAIDRDRNTMPVDYKLTGW